MRNFALALVLLGYLAGFCSAGCANLTGPSYAPPASPGSVCYGVLDYTVDVGSSCQLEKEGSLSSYPSLWQFLSSDACKRAASAYMCSAAYGTCGATVPYPCKEMCDDVTSACSSTDLALLQSQGVSTNCGVLPTIGSGCSANTNRSRIFTPPLPVCAPYTGQLCTKWVSGNVFLPAGFTIAGVEAALMANIAAFGLPAARSACLTAMSAFLCTKSFLSCDSTRNQLVAGVPLPLPRLPCRSVCDTYVTECADIVAAYPSLRPSSGDCAGTGTLAPGQTYYCNGTVKAVGQSDYPAPAMPLTFFSATANTTCNDIVVNATASPATCSALPQPTYSPVASTGSICSGVLDYKVEFPTTNYKCAVEAEAKIASLPVLLPLLSASCRDALVRYSCAATYQRCGATISAPCKNLCTNVVAQCSSLEQALIAGNNIPLDCTVLPVATSNLTCSKNVNETAPLVRVPLPACEAYTGTACAGIISGNVYIPAGYTQAGIESALIASGALNLAGVGTDCELWLRPYLCTKNFLACDSTTNQMAPGLPISLPKFPCRGICDNFATKCAALISAVPALTPNCSSTGTAPGQVYNCDGTIKTYGQPDFPASNSMTVFSVSPFFSTTCKDYTPATPTAPTPTRLPALPGRTIGQAAVDVGSMCYGVVDYPITIANGTCQRRVEEGATNYPTVWNFLQGSCRSAAARYMCASLYPKWGATVNAPCKGMCDAVLASCSSFEISVMTALGVPLTCSVLPADGSGCTSSTSMTVISPPIFRCELYTGKVCAGFTSGKVYVPAGVTQGDLEQFVKNNQFLFAVAPPETGCDKWIAPYFCSQAFLPCDDTSNQLAPGLYLPLPKFPCKRVCEGYKETCAPLYSLNPALVPNCSATGLAPGQTYNCDGTVRSYGQPTFTDSPTFFSTTPPVLSTTCSSAGLSGSSSTAQPTSSVAISCPAPLVIPDRPQAHLPGSSCALPCPLPFWSADETYQFDVIWGVFTWISTITLTYVSITWTVFPIKRKQTLAVLFNWDLAILSWVLSVTAIWHHSTGRHVNEIGCMNNAEPYDGDVKWGCTWLAFLVGFLTLGGSLLWWATSVDLWLQVAIGWRPPKDSKQYKMFQAFLISWAFGVPFIICVLMGYNRSLGATDGALPSCIFNSSHDGKYEYAWYYALGVHGVHGFVNTLWVLIMVIKSAFATGSNSSADSWRPLVRPLVFLWCFFFLFLSIESYRIWFYDNNAKWTAGVTKWLNCVLVDQFTTPGLTCGTIVPNGSKPDHPSSMFFVWMTAAQGFIEALIYGTQSDAYMLWYNAYCKDTQCCRKSSDEKDGDSRAATEAGSVAGSQAVQMGSKI